MALFITEKQNDLKEDVIRGLQKLYGRPNILS
jgi:hypothetical protein